MKSLAIMALGLLVASNVAFSSEKQKLENHVIVRLRIAEEAMKSPVSVKSCVDLAKGLSAAEIGQLAGIKQLTRVDAKSAMGQTTFLTGIEFKNKDKRIFSVEEVNDISAKIQKYYDENCKEKISKADKELDTSHAKDCSVAVLDNSNKNFSKVDFDVDRILLNAQSSKILSR